MGEMAQASRVERGCRMRAKGVRLSLAVANTEEAEVSAG